MVSIGIIGLGFVGGAAQKSFKINGVNVRVFDKYKDGGIGSIEDIILCEIVFLCLPTLYNETLKSYDKTAIKEVCNNLEQRKFSGLVVVKSTVEPETTNKLSIQYPLLRIAHNPEFLTTRTAFEDFHNQDHIVLGKGPNANEEDMELLMSFYKKNYPKAKISTCTAIESESMKIMCNSFYASKVMLFNEYYLLCEKNGTDFNTIKELMLKNNWINPMHTLVPGPDSKLCYGGACFPKDTNALCNYMKSKKSSCKVLESVIEERNILRDYNTNIISLNKLNI
jgi:UDPglucose 6-dehydrogenase